MTTLKPIPADPFTTWMARRRPRFRLDLATATAPAQGRRFAFYARTSTVGFQDPSSSVAWQREAATALIAGSERIIAEYVDLGCSRRVRWEQRPEASALLAAIGSASARFDAIVVGEYERAFSGRQLQQLLPYLTDHDVELWLPEFDGPVHPCDPTHVAVMLLLGTQSTREVQRSRFRVLAAMRCQTIDQGRYLGGRPPYGYRLVDAGPHPNAVHAQWGRRLHRLDPDPAPALNVRWIFAQRLSGCSLASIARHLNDAGIKSPSGADPGRNRNRVGGPWTVQTVASVLGNPRYTGRQVWNRQARVDNVPPAGSRPGTRRWNPGYDWIVSETIAHPGLVSESDFVAAQAIDATPGTPVPARRYALIGLLICAICGRRLEAHWSHGRPGYRCRHGHTSARRKPAGHPKNVYWREDHIIDRAAARLRGTAGSADVLDGPETAAQLLRDTGQAIECGQDDVVLTAGVSIW
ncbi:recombinase family protein [Cryptosporangium aurantiacum]|uniref:Recombinase zinc beta ribbon domain-containing protein n=1 Tax=Cryptosporangium aurantiacum TaxID=134849 RepID=A0A1M7RL70_9ACTN|nr:recombinase family protein [Cryptosporangium aurantiacum]SHN46909.1 Recombinase zinc beta ribbon domain-containing protein [Cryptosporangium aurantiacum]